MLDIGRQWSDRLRHWAEGLQRRFIRVEYPCDVSFARTMEYLTPSDALKMSFAECPVGTRWGKKWEYAWFRASFTVPEELAGERLVLTLGTAPEMLVWVNGAEAGSIDRQHKYVTLTRAAVPGTVYDILAEGYAGHGARNEGGGPVGIDEVTVPEPPDAQVTVGRSFVGVWNEPLYQAALDYLTLYSLFKRLPDRSLRAMKVAEGLERFTLTADLELPEPELTESVVRAAEGLKPLLECHNGSTAPVFSIFGQSHLDLAWLWPVEETLRKTARTYSNQLSLMDEYPEYRFLMCVPPIIETLRERYPALHGRVTELAREGRFYPDGALWVESDMNIPGGESIIRQFIYGRRWFRENMGVDSAVAWMPDTFGFPAQLPQIMAGCGVRYFATQKLTRQDPEAEPFPYNVFWWEGLDGTRVLSHLFKKSNAVLSPEDLIVRWEDDRIQDENIDSMLYPFGHGDGGGGPTRDMLETARRCRDIEGAPRTVYESPAGFFKRLKEAGTENVFSGELYLAWHRGTYTAQSETKRAIRKAEIALRQAEHILSRRIVNGEGVAGADRDKLDELWKLLLFNEFHDIAAGASIKRVHDRAVRELNEVRLGAQRLIDKNVTRQNDAKTVYNTLDRPRRYRGVTVPAQSFADVTASAYSDGERSTVERSGDGFVLQNDRVLCVFSALGELTSLRVKPDGRELIRGAGNRLAMFKDVNGCYDAWEISVMAERQPVELSGAARIEPFSDGDGAGLIVERRIHASDLTQRIYLRNGSPRVDFITTVDWRERHKLLKAVFPVDARAREAIEEIQFGYIKRPAHRSRQSDRDMYEVCCHRFAALGDTGGGVAILNDGKYGVSAVDGEVRLTLLRAPLMPDMTADQGAHEFTYSVLPFSGRFEDSGALSEAMDLNEPLIEAAPDGLGAILLADKPNIVVETIKPADRIENAVVARLYEAMGETTRTKLTVSDRVKRVDETDMSEENTRECGLHLAFRPFEIKTLLLHIGGDGKCTE